jgi:hypothetical protein
MSDFRRRGFTRAAHGILQENFGVIEDRASFAVSGHGPLPAESAPASAAAAAGVKEHSSRAEIRAKSYRDGINAFFFMLPWVHIATNEIVSRGRQ